MGAVGSASDEEELASLELHAKTVKRVLEKETAHWSTMFHAADRSDLIERKRRSAEALVDGRVGSRPFQTDFHRRV